jgi:hypothetical protein
MFNVSGKRNYKVVSIYGGTGKNGRRYTFITIEDMPKEGLKYGEKAKIHLWGEDLSSQIRTGDWVKILGCTDAGLEDKKDPNTNKWYKNFTIVCSAGDVVMGEEPFKKEGKQEPAVMQPIDDNEDFLPF